LSLAGELEVKA